jgi:type II secretory ATPase GspE/PulE/Tfp pilus assembly ATPase PilB-like protein
MRVRKDGMLQTVLVFSLQEFQKYLIKIKYMAKVRMNVEAQSQDGRFDMDITNNTQTLKVDIRVSIMPSLR